MITAGYVKSLALECGFDLAGVTRALPLAEAGFYRQWVDDGFAGEMRYLADHRAEVRKDPRRLLESARSIVCVGKLYNGPAPESAEMAAVSRYAWGEDYHLVLRDGLSRLVDRMRECGGKFEWKICVDTAPLLERAYARHAGLGWIGKNTCLINQGLGSWFFLGELLVSLDLAGDAPPPDRCGSCTRCIEACPTAAIVPVGVAEQSERRASRRVSTRQTRVSAPRRSDNHIQRPEGIQGPGIGETEGIEGPAWTIDSRLCIAYFTIELKGPIPAEARAEIGANVFGCDICQDVCPWNRRATPAREYDPAPPLERLAALSEEEFRRMFRTSAVRRAKYSGFLRNVAIAMGNLRLEKFREPLEKMAASGDAVVAEHARWALARL